MSTPVQIPLDSHYRGDKWVGIPVIGPVVVNGVTPSGALSRIRMHLVHPTGAVFRMDSDAGEDPDAPIVIDDSATWEAHVPEVQNFVQLAGQWKWDMEFYEGSDTSPQTLYFGSLNVRSDITR